jgi:hypothetical protein
VSSKSWDLLTHSHSITIPEDLNAGGRTPEAPSLSKPKFKKKQFGGHDIKHFT